MTVGPLVLFLFPSPAVRWAVARCTDAEPLTALDVHDVALVDDELHGAELKTIQGAEHQRAKVSW